MYFYCFVYIFLLLCMFCSVYSAGAWREPPTPVKHRS